MHYPRRIVDRQSQWYRLLSQHLLQHSTFLLHGGFIVALILVGIARYGRAFPVPATLLMTLWSVGLFLHGLIIYRRDASAKPDQPQPQHDLFKPVFAASVVNTVMWIMWALATDAADSTPWHLAIWLTFITLAVLAILMGKQALYRHWLKSYTENQFDNDKPKRHDSQRLSLQLEDDGEFADDLDDNVQQTKRY